MSISDQYQYQDPNIQKLVDPTVNEGNLTLDELTKRLGAYQTLSKSRGAVDVGAMGRMLDQKFKAFGVAPDLAAKAKPVIMQSIQDKNNFDPNSIIGALQSVFSSPSPNKVDNNSSFWDDVLNTASYLNPATAASAQASKYGYDQSQSGDRFKAYNQIPGAIDPLIQAVTNQDTVDEFSNALKNQINAPDVSTDISRLQGLVDAQNQANTNQSSLDTYISGLPDALKQQESQMLGAYDQSQSQQFQDVLAPQLLQSANARGALFSGDVPDLLSNAAGNIQGNREQLQAQMESQDNQFYFNAAYTNALNQQLQGQTNYSNYLQGEQNRVLQANQNQFQTNQQQLTNTNQNNLMQQQYQNQLRAYQTQLQQQQAYAQQQKTAGLAGGIGQTIGGIGMTGLGISTSNPYLIAGGANTTIGGANGIASNINVGGKQ